MTDKNIDELRFRCFCVMWGVGQLFHMLWQREWNDSFASFLLTATAIMLIFRPQVRFLVAAAFLQISAFYFRLPFGSNHWLFTCFVNGAIIFSWALTLRRTKQFNVKGNDLLEIFAPCARLCVVVLYFFVVFHKLNWDFLDPVTSCGGMFLDMVHSNFSFVPTENWARAGNAYFTLLVEALIPILLITRWRHLGAILGALFHFAITLTGGYYNFTSMILAMYMLFIDKEAIAICLERLRNGLEAVTSYKPKTIKGRYPIYLVLGTFAVIFQVHIWDATVTYHHYVYVIWLLYSIPIIFTFVKYCWKNGFLVPAEAPASFKLRPTAIMLLPILLFLNGLSPYLGLKTETAFAMYSNLRTEGSVSNHVIMPAALQLFEYQQDLIEIKGSSSKVLDELKNKNLKLTFFEFRDLAQAVNMASVHYVRGGKEYKIERIADNDELMTSPPLIVRKLLRFRPIDGGGRQYCRH